MQASLARIAEASCAQSDAAGQWRAYSMTSAGHAIRCRISVSAAGTITSGTCCVPGANYPVQSGNVSLANSALCKFTGAIRFGGLANTVSHATMSRDKTVVEGLGRYSAGQFVVSLVKI